MRNILLITLLISNIAFGQVKYLEKGEQAPFTGYLFTPEKESEVRQNNESLKYYKLLDESNQRIIQMKDQELSIVRDQGALWQTQSQNLSKQLEDAKSGSFWKQTLYFGLGALITTGLAFAVNQSSK